MNLYIVEHSLPGMAPEEFMCLQRTAVQLSEQFTAQGRAVRYLRSVFVPSESSCISLFEAPSGAVVRDVNEAAGIPFSRIVEALELTP